MSVVDDPPTIELAAPEARYPLIAYPPEAPSPSHGWCDLFKSLRKDSAQSYVEWRLM
jgi:hypothetical protein